MPHNNIGAPPTNHSRVHRRQPPAQATSPPHGWYPPNILGDLAGRHTSEFPPAFHCGEPSCSAFSNVSLVLMLTFTERLQLLSAYADWFASVLFFMTAHTVDNALREDHEQCNRCHTLTARRQRTGCFCAHYYSPMRHMHYGRAFSRAVALAGDDDPQHPHHHANRTHAHSHVIGVLMCHFDFYLNVRIFHGAAFDVPWLPRRGQVVFRNGELPVPRCFPVNSTALYDNDKSWFWFEEARPKCRACVTQLGGSECCYGWADILYVPRALMRQYGSLLAHFPDVHHEVAVPTAMRLLALRANVTLRALQCAGGTIGRMHAERFGPFVGTPARAVPFCAHRVNLSHPNHQSVVHQMLHDRW